MADVPPPGRAEADSRSVERRRSDGVTGNLDQFEGEIEKRLGRQARLAHNATQANRSAHSEQAGKLGSEKSFGRLWS